MELLHGMTGVLAEQPLAGVSVIMMLALAWLARKHLDLHHARLDDNKAYGKELAVALRDVFDAVKSLEEFKSLLTRGGRGGSQRRSHAALAVVPDPPPVVVQPPPEAPEKP